MIDSKSQIGGNMANNRQKKIRNKHLNEVLVTRKSGKHKTDKHPSRARKKEIERREEYVTN